MPLISVSLRIMSCDICGTAPRELNASHEGVSILFRPCAEKVPDRGPYSPDAELVTAKTVGLLKVWLTPGVGSEAIRGLR